MKIKIHKSDENGIIPITVYKDDGRTRGGVNSGEDGRFRIDEIEFLARDLLGIDTERDLND